jgi:hypothetical protein
MKARYAIVVLLLFTCTAGVGTIVFWPKQEEREELFNERHFGQLKNGMTRDEVSRTLGGPPGDYTEGKVERYHYGYGPNETWSDSISLPPAAKIKDEWYGPYGAIYAYFDENGLLTGKSLLGSFDPPPPRPPTRLERIKDWLASWF